MFTRISHLIATLTVVLIGVAVVAGQDPLVGCPSLTVEGEAIGGPRLGAPVGHTLKGLENYLMRGLTISWTLATNLFDPASVKIDGQGTARSSFIFPIDISSGILTMTATVAGLPVGCPNTASESVHWDGPPDAVKIGEMKNVEATDAALIKRFAAELKNNPNNQGFIFIGHPVGLSKEKIDARERQLAEVVTKHDLDNFDGSRITIVTRENTSDFAEFWSVPPGANNPTCEACVELPCPTISVNGPAGIPEPLTHIRFKAVVGGNLGRDIRYKWLVAHGQIIEGQETSAITVLPDRREGGVTATVEVDGLPKGCSKTASESSGIIDFAYAILIDEVDRPLPKIAESTFRLGAEELKNNPNDMLYIIAYIDKDVSQFDVRERVTQVSNFLIKEMRLTQRDFEIVTEPSDKNLTKIYRIPPGAEKPTP